jgi:hypothetical protein
MASLPVPRGASPAEVAKADVYLMLRDWPDLHRPIDILERSVCHARGSTSGSGSRVHREYSLWIAATGWTAWARRMVSAAGRDQVLTAQATFLTLAQRPIQGPDRYRRKIEWQSLALDLSLGAGPSQLKCLKSKKKKVAERVGFEHPRSSVKNQ